jgi:CRISPR/Cas system-associated exonuclease Cas4 (RecB family)
MLEGFKETSTTQIDRGLKAHTDAELYLTDPRSFKPPEWGKLQRNLEELTSLPREMEQLWGVTEKWEACGPFDADCWLRVKLDVVIWSDPVRVIDFKTGKPFFDKAIPHSMQAQLYSLATLSRTNTPVVAEFWYIDHEFIHPFTAIPKELAIRLRKMWKDRVDRMLNDTQLLPSPSKSKCKWCGLKAFCQYNAEEN